MAVNIPQVVTEGKASGASVIDGSLKFNGYDSAQYLLKTLHTGNRRTWTMAYWFKYDSTSGDRRYISTGYNITNYENYGWYIGDNSNNITFNDTGSVNGANYDVRPSAKLRDNAWYHLVFVLDINQSSDADKVKIYINGVLQTKFGNNTRPSANAAGSMNQQGMDLSIGAWALGGTYASGLEGNISQFYHIDGQALGPEEFGYTDQLTGTWRPKKFEGEFRPQYFDNWVDDTTGNEYNSSTQILGAFDGSTSTQAAAASSGTLTFTPSPAITGITKVRIHAKRDNSASSATITLNGSDISSNWSNGDDTAVEITVNNLTTLAWTTMSNGQWFGVRKIEVEVDGVYKTLTQGGVNSFYLPMDGESRIGEDKSGIKTRNEGQTWGSSTGYVDSDGTKSSVTIFDGSLKTYVSGRPSSTVVTLNTPITAQHKIRFYGAWEDTNSRWAVNGTATDAQPLIYSNNYTFGWSEPTGLTFPLTITSVGVLGASAGAGGRFVAVEVDGTILTDDRNGNSFKSVNFSEFNELSKATGARPLLNTGGGGAVARPGVLGSDSGFYEIVLSESGGGNPYIFNERGTRPTLSFIRGATYTFDYSAATSHPLRFATEADAANSSEYTDGTLISGNTIKFTVPHNAPDTLYYYCANHNGMGNSISVTTDETKADPYAWKNVLALACTGTAIDSSNELNCNSTTKVMTNSNVTKWGPGNFYETSLHFDGSTTGVTTPDSSDFNFGAGDFCMEAWARPESYPGTYGMLGTQYTTNNQSSSTFNSLNSGYYQCYFYYSTNALVLTDPNAVRANEWHHFAVTREGNVFRMFVDGKLVTHSEANITLNDSSANFTVGVDHDGNYHWDGQIQDVRVYKGVAKYTEDFIPASTNPLISLESPSGIASRTELTKVTDGSVGFNGLGAQGSSLELVHHQDLLLGTQTDWTVEFFIQRNAAFVDYDVIAGKGAGGEHEWYIEGFADGSVDFLYSADGATTWTGQHEIISNMAYGQWYHIALVRSSTGGDTFEAFVNGKRTLSVTGFNINGSGSGDLHIGGYDGAGGQSPKVNISNFRMVVGTAVYTSDFNPPTEKLTNITNTKLLCCQSDKNSAVATVIPTYSNKVLVTTSAPGTGDIGMFRKASGNFYYNAGYTSSVILEFESTQSGINEIKLRGGGYSVGEAFDIWINDVQVIDGRSTVSSWGEDTIALGGNYDIDKLQIIGSNGYSLAGVKLNNTLITGPVIYKSNSNDFIEKWGETGPVSSKYNPFTDDIDAVRGKPGRFATLNPLRDSTTNQGGFRDGLLTFEKSGSGYASAMSTIGMTTGKWYCEFTKTGTGTNVVVGIHDDTAITDYLDANSSGYGWRSDGVRVHDNTQYSNIGSYDESNIMGLAYDADNRTIYFYRDGVLMGSWDNVTNYLHADASRDLTGDPTWYFAFSAYDGKKINVNFGQKPFKFPPPHGYKPLTSADVKPETPAARPEQFVGITTWTGDGTGGSGTSDDRLVTGLSFKPDLVWCKIRTQSYTHVLWDSVRGSGVNKELQPNSTNQEGQASTAISGYITDFRPDGFKTVMGSTDNDYFDRLSDDYVAWCWKAGGNSSNFNIDDVGYTSAADANMSVGSVRSVQNVTAGNPFSAAWAGYNVAAVWNNNDSWSNLSPYASHANGKGYFSATETISDGHVFASGQFGNAPAGGGAGYCLRASTVCTIRFTVYYHINEIAVTNTDDETFAERTIVSVTPAQGDIVEATGKCFWFSTNSNVPNIAAMGTANNAPALPTLAPIGASVGTKQGFSIIQYTGNSTNPTSLPHGLSEAPRFVIVKNTTRSTQNWIIGHAETNGNGFKEGNQLYFTAGTRDAGSSNFFSGTVPTSQVFTVKDNYEVNYASDNYIAYLWHDVPGLQKFGRWQNTNLNDGAYVELGFRPAMIMFTDWDGGEQWYIVDKNRHQININAPSNNGAAAIRTLQPSSTNDEATADNAHPNTTIDFLASGFKIRTTNAASGEISYGTRNYIYAAWAEAPEFNLYGGQANARA